MNRQTHNLQQGSEEWHSFRRTHFGASELSAATGNSKYTTRGELLREKATGISKEIDVRTQALFDKGHAAEDAARKLAEQIIGAELSPMVMTLDIDGLPLSASLDGITFDGKTIFEHKLWNEKLADDIFNESIDLHYSLQIAQQLLVSGAEKCLFMTSDGTANNFSHTWIRAGSRDFNVVVDSWKQFAKDLSSYVPYEVKQAPKAEAIKALPAVFVQAQGMVLSTNIYEFAQAAHTFISAIKTDLVSDQDFADAESTVKFCKEAEVNLESTKKNVLAQMSTVDDVVRTLDHISAQLRDKRLMLDKLVKSEKENRKNALVVAANNKFTEHIAELQSEISGVQLNSIIPSPRFADVIKGMKSLASMQDSLDVAMAKVKIEANAIAKDVRYKLALYKEQSAGFELLFADLSSLISNNSVEAFQAIVNSRIEHHKAGEAAKEDAMRALIHADEKAIIQQTECTTTTSASPIAKQYIPSDYELIDSVSKNFMVSFDTARNWIINAAKRMQQSA